MVEVIIHGKPNAGSYNLTAGINPDFAKKFVDRYFRQSEKIKSGNCLIVEACLWDEKWYFAYTFFVNTNLTGVGQDNRDTYFALSVIVAGQYYCLVSEVYSRLKELYADYIAGRYIKNGRYIVQDFADNALFTGLVNKLNAPGFWINMLEPVDLKFRPNREQTFNVQYNVNDCDSKAFVQSLRDNGCIVVSESAPSKDELLTGINSLKQKLSTALSNITQKDEQIKQLENQINCINTAGNKNKDEKRKLQEKIDELKSRNENLSSSVSQLNDTIETYKDKLAKISSISEALPSQHEDTPKPVKNKSNNRNWLIIADTILLIVVIILLTFNKSCSSETTQLSGNVSDRKALGNSDTEDTGDTDNPEQPWSTITVSDSALEGVTTTTTDIDCGLKVKVDNMTFFKEANIDPDKSIIVTVDKEQSGYSIHTHNLQNGQNLRLDEAFNLKATNSNEPVIITYRSNDKEKLNLNNKITLTVK